MLVKWCEAPLSGAKAGDLSVAIRAEPSAWVRDASSATQCDRLIWALVDFGLLSFKTPIFGPQVGISLIPIAPRCVVTSPFTSRALLDNGCYTIGAGRVGLYCEVRLRPIDKFVTELVVVLVQYKLI